MKASIKCSTINFSTNGFESNSRWKGMKGMKKSREQLMNRHVITTTTKALRSIQIHTRLIVSFLMLSLMPLLIIGYMTYTHSSEDIKTKIESYSTQLMGEASKNLETEQKHL